MTNAFFVKLTFQTVNTARMQQHANFVNQVLSYHQEFVLSVMHIFLGVYYAIPILSACNVREATTWTQFPTYVQPVPNKDAKYAKKMIQINVLLAIPNSI